MKNIYVIYGGVSVEHEVSLLSATNVINCLDREKYVVYPVYVNRDGKWIPYGKCEKFIDDPQSLKVPTDSSLCGSFCDFLGSYLLEGEDNVMFPVVHGSYGEDGTIQGFFEMLNIPYVGSDVLASSLCMDKAITNQIFDQNEIPQAKYRVLKKEDFDANDKEYVDNVVDYLGLPIFVKPCRCGSSVGVTQVKDKEKLIPAIIEALSYDNKILLEEAVVGDELQVSVIGNDKPLTSLPGVSRVQQEFYNYEGKYFDDNTIHIVPFELEEGETEKVRELAKKVFKSCTCSGLARVDIFLRDSDREMLVNEINTSPGMTNHSMTTMLWKVTDGCEFSELLDRLINYGIERYETNKNLIKEI